MKTFDLSEYKRFKSNKKLKFIALVSKKILAMMNSREKCCSYIIDDDFIIKICKTSEESKRLSICETGLEA